VDILTSSTTELGNGTAANGTDRYGNGYNETESGDAVVHDTGGANWREGRAVNGTNTTIFDNELSQIQMIGLTGLPGQARLMCMRVSLEQISGGHHSKASVATMLTAMGLAVMSVVFALL
jgi:hypothetical protein